MADSVLLNGPQRKNVARSSSFTPAIPLAEDLDQTVSFDSNVSSSIIRPDADSTTRSSLVLNQETALALDSLQRRRSGTHSKLPIPSPSNRPPVIKSMRGYVLPDADATLNPASSSSSSESSLPQKGLHSKQSSPFKSPLPPPKVRSPDESLKRAIPTPQKMAKTIADSSAKPNRASTPGKVARLLTLSGAASEPDVLGAVGGVEKVSREEATLGSQRTPQRGSRSLSKDSSAPSRRFSSPFSSPLFNSKKGKSPSPVLPRLARPFMGEIASKAASLKAAVETKFSGDKGKRKNLKTNGATEKQKVNAEVLPSMKKTSKMPATRRESTFTREIPAEIPTIPTTPPKAPASKLAAEPRRRGNKTSK